MKRREKNSGELVDAHLGAFRSPAPHAIAEARERTLQRLRLEPVGAELAPDQAPVVRVGWKARIAMLAAAAGVAAVALLQVPAVQPPAERVEVNAVVKSADGASQRIEAGEIVRTAQKGGLLTLADGSRVEMRAHSELLLERAHDGVRIRLNKGGLIVNAAQQRTGHLYVQTKDVTVSVIGTVFLVNAEEQGSQVAVIEGEVRVQHGMSEKKLRRGEQVATGPLMEPQPVNVEIAWSQNADAHVALLQQSVNAAVPARTGAVTGIVRTAEGNPAAGVRVTAMRSDAADDTLRAMASLTQTDETGRYRLENVPPGSYFIAAGRVDMPTFYPGTLEIAKGTAISISSSATVADIDFVIRDTSAAVSVTSRDRAAYFSAVGHALVEKLGRLSVEVKSLGAAAWWLDPERVRRLGLTDDQKKKIEEILQASPQNQARAERAAVLAKIEASILPVLTESQRAQLQMEKAPALPDGK